MDMVVLRHSCRLNSLSGLVVTRLDVLSGLTKLKVASKYTLNGEDIHHMPMNTWEFARVQPVYDELAGWSENLRDCRSISDLPPAARDYLGYIESCTGTPVAVVSVGPDREETIFVRPDLIWG